MNVVVDSVPRVTVVVPLLSTDVVPVPYANVVVLLPDVYVDPGPYNVAVVLLAIVAVVDLAPYVTVVGGPRTIVAVTVLDCGDADVGAGLGVDVGIVSVVVVGVVTGFELGTPLTTKVDPD